MLITMRLFIRRKKMVEYNSRGQTLILVIMLVTAILAITLGILNVIIGQIQISGDAEQSFQALYAADQGIEKWFYIDRNQSDVTSAGIPLSESSTLPSGACYYYQIDKSSTAPNTQINSYGINKCPASGRVLVKRALQAAY